ncbi:MAG: hypothetical protein CTY25_12095 [Methylobacterium sp.]|nr:MAG: hypothetical protein CTY25_12095 [Methylobacterium sp.]
MGRAIGWTFKTSWYVAKAGWPLIAVYLLIVPTLVESVPAAMSQAVGIAGPGLGVAMIAAWSLMQPGARPLVLLASLYSVLDGADVVWSMSTWSGSIPLSAIAAVIGSVLLTAASVAFAFPGIRKAIDEKKGVSSRRSSSDLHGAANWVSRADVRRISEQGNLILGQEGPEPNSRLVRYPIEGHGLTIAPTRSGKGVGFILPNILKGWTGPMVVIDPKAESVFVGGAAREAMGHKVHVLDPFGIIAERSAGRPEIWQPRALARYNPLDAIDRGDDMPADISTLCEALLPPAKASSGSGGNGDHFRVGASRMIMGAIAWVIRTMPRHAQHLGSVYDLISGPDLQATVEAWSRSDVGLCLSAAGLLLGVSDKERGSFISTATNSLAWLEIPQLRRQVETSTCSLDEMIDGTADYFVCVPPHRLEQSRIWMRIWSTLPLAAALRKKPKERVLLLIDEAPLIGRLDPILQAYRVAAGMGVSCWLISQSMPDLESEYGKEAFASLIANAEVLSFFEISHANHESAQKISAMIGDATYLEESASDNSGSSAKLTDVFSSHSSGSSSSRKEIKRPLILPSEIKAMKPNEILVLQRSKICKGPIRLYQSKYFERPDMRGLAKPNPYR